jgi:maltose O-acetyltransferase
MNVGRLHRTGLTVLHDLRFSAYSLLMNSLAGSPWIPRLLRRVLYRAGGVKCGKANLYHGIRFLGTGPVQIATGVMINVGVILDNKAEIRIGENVHIGPGCFLCTSSHSIGDSSRRAGQLRLASIVLGCGSWIGANTTICPGVVIGDGCVVAAGSVVTSECLSDGLYAGVPARRIRDLPHAVGDLAVS